MDILPSDLYADPQGSDDSLPDLSTAFGLKTNHNRPSRLQPSASPTTRDDEQNTPSSSQEMFRRINRTTDQATDALARIRQIYLDSSIPQQTRLPTTSTDSNTARQHIQIDLDPISSSPIRSTRGPVDLAKTVTAPPKILSRPPLPTLGARTPLHRVQTFPAVNPARPSLQEKSRVNSLNIYHEISDDDEDLRAAIAASLADFHTPRPKSPPIAPERTSSVFLYPDEILRSSPPMSHVSAKHAPPPSSQLSAKGSEPPSSGSSARVRDDTRRMLMALDELTTNILKRKNEEVPTQAKKKSTAKKSGSENGDAAKPRKRAGLTQDEKVVRIKFH